MAKKDIGRNISDYRKKIGLTQQELAEILGVTNKAVSKWETGKGMPDVGILPALSTALGIDIDGLFAGERDPIYQGSPENPISNVYFKAQATLNLTRLKQQCKISYWRVNRFPRIICFICALLIFMTVAALIVAKMLFIHINVLWLFLAVVCTAFLCCLLGWRLRARMLLNVNNRENGKESEQIILFLDDRFVIQNEMTKREYHYFDIETVVYDKDAIFFYCRGMDVLITPEDMDCKTTDELLAFIKENALNAKYLQIEKQKMLRLVAALLISAAGGCLGIVQLCYLTIGRANRVEYLYDNMSFFVNASIIICALIAGILLWHNRKRIILVQCILAALLLIGNFIFMGLQQNTLQKTIVSSSPSGVQLILKLDTETDQANLCRRVFLWFVMPKDALSQPVTDGKIKIQWLENDVGMVTYMSPLSDYPQVYVATYGDRSSHGMSYYSVLTALSGGSWKRSNSLDEWGFYTGNGGITIANREQSEFFAYEDTVQCGTTALILYENGIAKWVVALGTDCKVDGGELEAGGSIIISPVGMEKTSPILFHNIKVVRDL